MVVMNVEQSKERTVRDRLNAYLEEERDIDLQIERIENLESKMKSLQSPALTDMPKSHNTKDKFSEYAARKDELEREAKAMIEHHVTEKKWIEGILKNVRKADERACIKMRYIDIESWRRISKMMFGMKKDYRRREDSYIRRTTNVHRRAIRSMALYLICQEGGSVTKAE